MHVCATVIAICAVTEGFFFGDIVFIENLTNQTISDGRAVKNSFSVFVLASLFLVHLCCGYTM